MVELYRASAGSGKTYTLAKKYLWYYLTIRPEGGSERLRTESELADSARHILAVTFTNKATNEMQQRIVEALYKLSTIKKERKVRADGSVVEKNPDYMDEFCDALNVSPEQLATACKTGLSILLENYSDFNVSTIDSFFQTVLRTFAYESELNDSYQVEIDNEFLSQLGVDATLDEIDSNEKDTDTPFWIKILMDRTEKGKWNMFTRPEKAGTFSNGENPYADFIKSVQKLDNEEYKLIRKETEDYFTQYSGELSKLYRDLHARYEKPVKEAYRLLVRTAKTAFERLPDDIKFSTGGNLQKFKTFYNRILGKSKLQDNTTLSWHTSPGNALPESPINLLDDLKGKKNKWTAWATANSELLPQIKSDLELIAPLLERWAELVGTREFRHWKLYADNLPFYALFGIASRKRQEYLDENNAVELGETSMILRSVIGDSDTPFIYERLGTRLNHFLIDEFQDTSRMQWDNLSPLLHESISRDNGNLIIGDAKQSIYRFRNADPSLITSVVPQEFGPRAEIRGNIPSENTNYRSELRIVQFNNSFFDYLVADLDARRKDGDARHMKFRPLYSNVIQRPAKTRQAGYVEVEVLPEGRVKRTDDSAGNINQQPSVSREEKVSQIVMRLIERGFQQREIAVLVSRNSEGEAIINEFSRYNSECGPEEKKIRFVSEQSLKVASSEAVGIITGVLENMARGSNPELNNGDERRKKGVGNWRELESNFKYYQINNPGKDTATTLDSYIQSGAEFNALSELLKEMQSLTIPAVVEAVCNVFLTEELRASDAVYIAAFQDLVLEYCERHPTDIGSFLNWWSRKKKSASIASPENIDAVQILTVHKSKGLQYECVIVPFADWDFSDKPGKTEWRWVKPEVIAHESIPLPPYLPVETGDSLEGTVHEQLLDRFIDLTHMDRLNAAYVAFTRAKQELYIISKGSGETSIATILQDFLTAIARGEAVPPPETTSEAELRLERNVEIISEADPFRSIVGVPTPAAEVGLDRKTPPQLLGIPSYDSVKSPAFLKYRAVALTRLTEVNEQEAAETEDLDIRSEGTLKHAVLELVEKASDLPKAIRHLQLTGELPDTLASSVEADLSEALARPDAQKWFDGTARVLNERPVLKRGYVTRRPDRLLVYPDGSATVIDYKFGRIPTNDRHLNQIRQYVELLRETGRYTKVKGFLWYVNENKIIEV